MTVTIQIQVDSETQITEEEIDLCEAEMNECCAMLQKIAYVRAEIYVDNIARKAR